MLRWLHGNLIGGDRYLRPRITLLSRSLGVVHLLMVQHAVFENLLHLEVVLRATLAV